MSESIHFSHPRNGNSSRFVCGIHGAHLWCSEDYGSVTCEDCKRIVEAEMVVTPGEWGMLPTVREKVPA